MPGPERGVHVALKRIKPVWIVFAVAGVVITAAGLMHLQLLTSRGKALAVIAAEIRRTEQANVSSEQAIRDLPELRQAVHRFAKQVAPDSDMSHLLESVGTDPAGKGTPEREIVTKPTVAGQPVSRVPFSLQYRGSFRGTIALLDRLHHGELFTRVERIVVEKGASPAGENSLRVQLDFSTFARSAKELEAWAHVEP